VCSWLIFEVGDGFALFLFLCDGKYFLSPSTHSAFHTAAHQSLIVCFCLQEKSGGGSEGKVANERAEVTTESEG
jgi:hypothetical protein